MKKLAFGLIALCVSVGAFAQERVTLDSNSISINAHQAVIVRTAASPKKIDIDMVVPMSEPVCERYDTRMVIRTSGAHCGYVRERRVEHVRVCVARHPNGECATYRREENVVYRDFPRTCSISETYCSQYGTVSDYKRMSVRIRFKDPAPLAAGEEETFSVVARQKNYGENNAVFSINAIETKATYTIKSVGWFGNDSFEIIKK